MKKMTWRHLKRFQCPTHYFELRAYLLKSRVVKFCIFYTTVSINVVVLCKNLLIILQSDIELFSKYNNLCVGPTSVRTINVIWASSIRTDSNVLAKSRFIHFVNISNRAKRELFQFWAVCFIKRHNAGHLCNNAKNRT